MKLENIVRQKILNLNFSIKGGIKRVLKTKKKYRWSWNIRDYIVDNLHSKWIMHDNCK